MEASSTSPTRPSSARSATADSRHRSSRSAPSRFDPSRGLPSRAVRKYIGSKRRLVPVLGEICGVVGARRALDLFAGTTRVAQEFKRRGAHVTAVDSARYAEVFAQCYVVLDGDAIDEREIVAALDYLAARPPVDGYV